MSSFPSLLPLHYCLTVSIAINGQPAFQNAPWKKNLEWWAQSDKYPLKSETADAEYDGYWTNVRTLQFVLKVTFFWPQYTSLMELSLLWLTGEVINKKSNILMIQNKPDLDYTDHQPIEKVYHEQCLLATVVLTNALT